MRTLRSISKLAFISLKTKIWGRENMDKIYLVIGGEYSDWYVKCFFENKIDAEKYCADNLEEDFDIYEVTKKELTKEQHQIKLLYVQEIIFDIIDNNLKLRKEPERYKFTRDYTKNRLRKFEISRSFQQRNFRWICFTIEEQNRTKAEKIAQDYAYQFVALLDQYTPQQAETIINQKFIEAFKGASK